MKVRIDTASKLYSPALAERMIADLNAGDDDWTYSIVEVGNDKGFVRIDIHDEDGDFVASCTL